jgi:hypothetical protein
VSGEAGAANEAANSGGGSGRSKDLVLAVCFDVRTRGRASAEFRLTIGHLCSSRRSRCGPTRRRTGA